jgi:hypothetical protein
MSKDDQWEVSNPFGERVDHLTAKQRVEMERGAAWAAYINGGQGEPRHFDHSTWAKGEERKHAAEQEHQRRKLSR